MTLSTTYALPWAIVVPPRHADDKIKDATVWVVDCEGFRVFPVKLARKLADKIVLNMNTSLYVRPKRSHTWSNKLNMIKQVKQGTCRKKQRSSQGLIK